MTHEAYVAEEPNPVFFAKLSLNRAHNFWLHFAQLLQSYGNTKLGDPDVYFFTEILDRSWNDPLYDGNKLEKLPFPYRNPLIDKIGESIDIDHEKVADQIEMLHSMFVAVAYSVQAMKAKSSGDHNMAWRYACDAQYWSGVLIASMVDDIYKETPASQLAQKRHLENYALSDYAIRYYRENIDKNLSAENAANELLGVVKLSHKKLAALVSKEKNDYAIRYYRKHIDKNLSAENAANELQGVIKLPHNKLTALVSDEKKRQSR